ncbi:hypothetical protein [Mycobacterium sp. E740]|uniref:hypothetical protein n=1 Tax=Mycobacterium sp. E740 TaxID=1834149 RepID=UPI0007FFE3D0|nr:hypothetical protein A5663_05640 [Mycobacterium sp. E740]
MRGWVADGAGGAMTVGEKGWGPFGSMRGAFSVGRTAEVLVVVVVVVVVVSCGPCFPSLEHEAANMTITTAAVPPATAAMRRPN